MSPYVVYVKPSLDKALQRFPSSVQSRIVMALDALGEDPRPRGAVKLTNADNLWRIRVGKYRVIYEIDDARRMVMVLRLAHRKEAY